ncbi:hypothetical protein ACLFKX_15030 [Enterobacter hormaechei]
MSVLFSIVLALSVIALLWVYFTRTQDEGFGTISGTTLFLFNNKDVVTVIHKGVLKKEGKSYLIDRNYTLSVKKSTAAISFILRIKS